MGNCQRKNQISSAQDDEMEDKRVEQMMKASSSSPKLGTAWREDSMKKKKVRFKIQDGRGGKASHGNSSSGAMRITLVVTKEELKRVLSTNNIENDAQHTSLEQLLSDMNLTEKRVSKIEESDGSLNSWRPALESIPEDRSMK